MIFVYMCMFGHAKTSGEKKSEMWVSPGVGGVSGSGWQWLGVSESMWERARVSETEGMWEKEWVRVSAWKSVRRFVCVARTVLVFLQRVRCLLWRPVNSAGGFCMVTKALDGLQGIRCRFRRLLFRCSASWFFVSGTALDALQGVGWTPLQISSQVRGTRNYRIHEPQNNRKVWISKKDKGCKIFEKAFSRPHYDLWLEGLPATTCRSVSARAVAGALSSKNSLGASGKVAPSPCEAPSVIPATRKAAETKGCLNVEKNQRAYTRPLARPQVAFAPLQSTKCCTCHAKATSRAARQGAQPTAGRAPNAAQKHGAKRRGGCLSNTFLSDWVVE